MDDVLLLGANKQLLDKLMKQLMDRFEMADMGDVSRVLGMNVTRDREEGIIMINQKEYTEDIVQRYEMRGCNPAYTPGVGPELSLDQPEENLLDEEGKRRYQSITGAAIYLAQACRCDILYTVNQLARAMSKPSKAHMGVTKNILRITLLGRVHRFLVPPTSKKVSNSRPFPTQIGEQTPTMGSLHHHTLCNDFQRPDQLQGGHSRIDCTIYNGGRIGGGGAYHEGSSLLQQYEAGARLQGRVRQRAALH